METMYVDAKRMWGNSWMFILHYETPTCPRLFLAVTGTVYLFRVSQVLFKSERGHMKKPT